MSDKQLHRLLALAMFLVPLVIYLLTMAATVSFWDSGEFIATSYILGIPHSPGTPLYVLVGRVFTMLPLPLSVAQRVNFISVIFSSLAVMMVYLIITATLRFMYPGLTGRLGRFMSAVGALTGSLYLAFSKTYWWDATEAEVYALSAFVMGLCTWLALEWYRNPAGHAAGSAETGRRDAAGRSGSAKAVVPDEVEGRHHARGLVYIIIYLLALGIGFHLGTVLVFGGIFLLFLLVKEKAFSNMELIIFTFGFAVLLADMTLYRSSTATIIGLLFFAALLIWSARYKERFALAATGIMVLGVSVHLFLYIRSHLDPGIDMVDPETWKAMYAHLRREQYPPINVLERKASLGVQIGQFGRYFREQFRMIGDAYLGPFNMGQALTAIPLALGFLGIAANYVRERRTWVLNMANLVINSVGLIVFLNFSSSEVRERDYFYGPAFYFFAIFIGIGATWLLVTIAERAERKKAERFPTVVPVGMLCLLLSCLPIGHNWWTHDRSNHNFAEDYGRNILGSLEPDAILFTYGDNDTYPLWYLQNVERYRNDVRIANLSLLHTDWYIKQLRDREPKVPISYSDAEIERLRPVALKGGGVAWRNDLMVQHIINMTAWHRPIYFSTGTAVEAWRPYAEHLEMQGLVRKLVPRQGRNQVNVALLERNLGETFSFRGIVTPDWKPDNTTFREKDFRFVLNNYAVAMLELASAKAMKRDFAGAARWAERALLFEPELTPAQEILGTYYALAGSPQRAVSYYDSLTRHSPGSGEYWLRFARIFTISNQYERAFEILERGIANVPDFRQLYVEGFQYAARIGKADTARNYIERWLERHPDDSEFAATLQDFEGIMKDAGHGTAEPGDAD